MAPPEPQTQLQRAFETLRREHRMIVEEDCACCGTCAHSECSMLLGDDPDKIGYVFFHNQDLYHATSGQLYLGHAARDGMPEKVPALVTCDVLRDFGFEVEWDGDVNKRIKVAIPAGPERDYFCRMVEEQNEEMMGYF